MMRNLDSRVLQWRMPLERKCLKGAVFALSLIGIAAPALAVSVTNRDDKEHKLTIIEGDAKVDRILAPSGSLDGICLKGCVIRLSDSENDEYELEGPEVVSIEDGYLYNDAAESGGEMAPGPQAQPPSSGTPTPDSPSK